MLEFRTDLALERRDLYRKANQIDNEIDGIETTIEEVDENITTTRVAIMDERGEQALGKPKGNYITIDIHNLKIAREEEIEKAGQALQKELKALLDKNVQPQEDILVVGLGNIYVTPDALGPKVISYIDVTRHIAKYMPEALQPGTRSVSAISPGVLGTTGIETVEILKGIVENIQPKLIIVIDALASKSIERISSTIQIADTGIVPGAGVGNTRKEISTKTLGIPVIAIGVPTVVDAATIAADSLDLFMEKMQNTLTEKAKPENVEKETLYKVLSGMEESKYEMIKEVLTPEDFNFIVTPKEIDELIENMSSVVARGINFSV